MPPKRNSLSRVDGLAAIEDAFRSSTLSRREIMGGGGSSREGRMPFRREASVPRGSANWSDSLPRKDMFSSQTNSLPRRGKAGLGRPEPDGPKSRDGSANRENPFRDAILGKGREMKIIKIITKTLFRIPRKICLISPAVSCKQG